ncbi:hypothetical protein CPT_Maja_063 [Burkholderia phage Maja]|uniref:Uncharacterized protein n=1 Tax=Burkholderia phage Maja TaxID=2767571 RepID=A0A7S6R889_9CAUD|nr:hypothetical protein CPT_Maja_063 [Burkholderia phage Maja]
MGVSHCGVVRLTLNLSFFRRSPSSQAYAARVCGDFTKRRV